MSQFVASRAYDYFDLGDESDEERAESSEDEIDIILHGTPEQRRRLRQIHEKEQQRKSLPGRSESRQPQDDEQELASEDDFEREMNAELEKTVHMLEESRDETHSKAQASSTSKDSPAEGSSSRKKKTPFYNSIYFDSDDEENYEGEGDAKVPRQHAQPSNDDLMYDPHMDDEDQMWVDQQRQHHLGNSRRAAGNIKKKGGVNKKQTAPRSDALLDCPACMTTLCLDCQRHDIYQNQYRAMFVMNCKVNTSEVLSVPEQSVKKKSKSNNSKAKGGDSGKATDSANQSSLSSADDKFHQVTCKECNTVVGVVDMDEVYHFFNVLASQP